MLQILQNVKNVKIKDNFDTSNSGRLLTNENCPEYVQISQIFPNHFKNKYFFTNVRTHQVTILVRLLVDWSHSRILFV